jgi:hypothetical protein
LSNPLNLHLNQLLNPLNLHLNQLLNNIFTQTKKLRTFKKVINHIVMHYVNLGHPEINMVVILEKVLQMLWIAIHIKKNIVLKNVRMLIIHVMLLNPLNLLLNQLLKPLNLHLNQLSNPLSLHLNQLLNPLNLHQNPMLYIVMKDCLLNVIKEKLLVVNHVNGLTMLVKKSLLFPVDVLQTNQIPLNQIPNKFHNNLKLCLILKMMVTNNVNLLPKMNLSLLIVWISKLKLSTLLIGD